MLASEIPVGTRIEAEVFDQHGGSAWYSIAFVTGYARGSLLVKTCTSVYDGNGHFTPKWVEVGLPVKNSRIAILT